MKLLKLLVLGGFQGSAHLVAFCVLLVGFMGIAVYAVCDGGSWRAERNAEALNWSANVARERGDWHGWASRAEAGEEIPGFRARPMALPVLAVLPVGPLGELAHRHESLYPRAAVLNGFSNDALVFRRHELAGPVSASRGAIDLTLVAVVVMPLVILVSAFGALSADRENGRLSLLLVQGGVPARILVWRVLAAGLPAWLIMVMMALLAAWPLEDAARLARLGLWVAVLTGYWALWIAIAGAATSWAHRSVNAVLSGVALWILLVVVLPSVAHFVATAIHPPPSQVVLLAEARTAEGAARVDVDQRAEAFMAEHGHELPVGGGDAPGFHRSGYLANLAVNERVAPILAEHRARQQAREGVLSALQYTSPALLANRAMTSLAGAGPERAVDFRHQVSEHLHLLLQAIGPAVVAQVRMDAADALAVPEFEFRERVLSNHDLLAAPVLFLLTGLAGAAAFRGARRGPG